MTKKMTKNSHKTNPKKKGICMKKSKEVYTPDLSVLDLVVKNITQPRRFSDYLKIGLATAGASALVYVTLKALDTELTSVVEHRDANRMAKGKMEFGEIYQTRAILSEEDKDRLYKPLLRLPGKDERLG